MSSSPSRTPTPRRYGYLIPFALLAAGGFLVLAGWWSGTVVWVQPRSYDAPLAANAAACFVLIGLTPLLLGLRWHRAGLVTGFLAIALALGTMLQDPLGVDLGIDQLLVDHARLVAGSGVARMPAALAGVCTLSALLVVWLAVRPRDRRLAVALGLVGSLVLAYAITALLAYRNGLNLVGAWQAYARLGPPAAGGLLLLGGALIGLAAHQSPDEGLVGARWLWLPVVACGLTITGSFWVSLREREIVHTHATTQLTMDYIAALFSGETETQARILARLAKRSSAMDRAEWERDVARIIRDFDSYRSIQLIGPNRRTQWYAPAEGREDVHDLDHGADPRRRAALAQVQGGAAFGVAAPLESPEGEAIFVVYAQAIAPGAVDGFVGAEFFYDRLFATIDRRLNLSRRYQASVSVEMENPGAGQPPSREVYVTPTGDQAIEPRLHRTAHYQILDQHLVLTLAPRPGAMGASRQYLPELTLYAGVGVSLLLGLVTNLAQAALRRQRAAEQTSRQLAVENEERRRIEGRLKSADERLNLAFESTLTGAYEWDVETDRVYCTPSIWKLIGAEPAEMPETGSGWLGLLHPDDRPAVRAVIDAHFRGETPLIEIEHCVHLKSGEWMWLALRAKCISFSAARHPRRVLGTVQNINARKRADEALRTSQAESRKLSLVASRTDNAVVITDPLGQVEWANESYSRLTGRPLAQLLRQPLAGFLASPDADPGAVDRIQAALVAADSLSTEAIHLAADGQRAHVHLDLQPILGEDGSPENFIVIATDITARVETETQLRRAKEEADTASRAKSDFLASMSHEIRTPMNGVIGMTSLLLDTDLSPEQRDYVSTIRTSGDALLSIINEILDFSKIESGRMELENQPFELTQCVEEVVDIFAAQAAAKGIELAYCIDAAVPPCILGDITRLRQVLVNLTNNAVKFTPKGFVTLEVRLAADARPAEGDFLLDFVVADTGIGIPPDRQHLLFKPFSQVDSSTTRKYGGTGLGLAICHRLCEMMGGSIELDSAPGRGSSFHFCIRTQAVSLADTGTPLFAPLHVRGPVLAVDDHPVNRAMLEQCLRKWSIAPQVAATAAEALERAVEIRPAAVIIDQDLGGTSGVDLISRLREKFPTLPVILLAPAHGSLRRDESFDALVFRLPKPIKPYPLHDTLRRALAGAGGPGGPDDFTGVAMRLAESIPLNILLAEDNPVNQKVALGYLKRMGYEADAVANGLEAVAAVQKRRFDLVFMDLQMPEMDGTTATVEIRRLLPVDAQPVILALTANAMPGDRERCLAAGMNDHLTKPVKLEDLQSAIQRFFGQRIG
jgi:PAS domain S-box-containing protein